MTQILKVARAVPESVAAATAPQIEDTARAQVDRMLNDCIRANSELDLVSFRFAIDDDLRSSDMFNLRRRLVLAEVLRLVAESVDPSDDQRPSLAGMRHARQKLSEALNIGIGQMLERLRPREELAHQVILWKANSNCATESALPAKQTSVIIGPNRLSSRAFQKVVERELRLTNLHIGLGEYRSFLFLPLTALRGESMGLLPYMRIAQKYNLLVVGSLPLSNSLDSAPETVKRWRFSIADVDADDSDVLSHATVVLNHLVIRDPYAQYFETQPLTVGLSYAFAAAMTRYFQRKKIGHWYIPVAHPRIKARDMRTVNVVDRLDDWHSCVKNGFNFAYTTTESQDGLEPGVRIEGGATVFPEAALDKEKMGSEAVPLIQAQARAVKNRICQQLRAELEKLIGGQFDEEEVRQRVRRYLNGLFLQKQIYGFHIHPVEKSATGTFCITIDIRWSATADEFVIKFSGRPGGEADVEKSKS